MILANGPVAPTADGPYWLTSEQFSQLVEINGPAARKALLRATEGHTWNGSALVVRKQGRAYQVDARSLPEHLYRKFWEANREAITPAAVSPQEVVLRATQRGAGAKLLSKQYRIAEWLAGIVAPALRFPRGTHGRGEVLRSLAELTHVRPTDGKPCRFAQKKLREFCRRLEEGGVHALMRKERKSEDAPRCLVNRRWASICPLPMPEKDRLAQEIESYVRGLWAAGAPSRNKVRQLASAELAKRCREAGWPDASVKNCDVGQYLVESNQDARTVAVYHRDAKRFSDIHRPRILRDRGDFLPGECIVGDVHPVDVYLDRPDGSTYTPRMIAWYDLATNRSFWSLVHCEPGRSVTQAHVTRSFVDLCMSWGIPRRLYLDNGSEYSWDGMVDGFKTLAGLGAELDLHLNSIEALEAKWVAEAEGTADTDTATDSRASSNQERVIVRAKPYNAAAKPIEGAFSAKEKVFSMLPGYIGGNRMNKRLTKVGAKPPTYPGTAEAFDREFAEAMAFFHATPQRGHLRGLSPDECFAQRSHLATVTRADETVFIKAFSEEKSLKVRTQGVQLGAKDGGRWYWDDALIPLIGTRQRFLFAKWRPDALVLVQGNGVGEAYTAIREARVYGFFDEEGAKEASRREGIAKRHVRQLKAGADKVDLQEAMRTYVDEAWRNAPQAASETGSKARHIGMSPALQALTDQLKGENPNPVVKLTPGEFVDADGVVHRLPSRKEILRQKAEAAKATAPPDYKFERPEPKAKDIFDLDELGRRELEEVKRKRQEARGGRVASETTRPI